MSKKNFKFHLILSYILNEYFKFYLKENYKIIINYG